MENALSLDNSDVPLTYAKSPSFRSLLFVNATARLTELSSSANRKGICTMISGARLCRPFTSERKFNTAVALLLSTRSKASLSCFSSSSMSGCKTTTLSADHALTRSRSSALYASPCRVTIVIGGTSASSSAIVSSIHSFSLFASNTIGL